MIGKSKVKAGYFGVVNYHPCSKYLFLTSSFFLTIPGNYNRNRFQLQNLKSWQKEFFIKMLSF